MQHYGANCGCIEGSITQEGNNPRRDGWQNADVPSALNLRRREMQLTEKHKQYWNINLKITSILLAIWFVVTFVMGWYARELNEIIFLGPLGFYMSAQGSLIIYVVIIWFYARYMNNLDKEYGVHEGELE
jgi:putative solute:sodium symporter small subunit